MASIINALSSGTGGIVNAGDASGILQLQTANTAAVTIDASQNVGIGTSSPLAKHHVSGGQSYVTGPSGSGAYTRWYNNAQTTNDFQVGQGWVSASDNVAVVNNNANAAMIFGTNGTERMRISSAGIVTKPYNPAFVALGIGGNTSYSSGAEFILANAYTNIGSNYSTSTGRFTAPVAGFYSFTYAIYSYAGSTQQIAFKKNGSDFAPGTDTEGLNSVVANYISGTSFMVYLAANDTASFGWRNGSSGGVYHGHSWFSGHLVG